MADEQVITVRIDARAICDDRGCARAPGALLVEIDPRATRRLRLLAAGTPAEIDRHPGAAGATRIDRSQALLIPGLVNAHTHLDLTHIGPLAHDPAKGFVRWVDRVRTQRRVDEAGIGASVQRGAALCVAGATVAVGDIGGAPEGRPSLAPLRALRGSDLIGVSYIEFFAIGAGEARGRAAVEDTLAAAGSDGVREGVGLGLQPHASNTIGIETYRWSIDLARRRGMPICTHLAETSEERQFVMQAGGPQRVFLEQLGLWEDRLLADIGRAQTPVQRLRPCIEAGLRTLVHVNDASDADIEILADAGATVIYCPRAATYFDAAGACGAHRYREMRAAGVRVALGTDSLVSLPPEAAGAAGMSVWDEMRLLARRDGADGAALLQMATTAGAEAIGIEPDRFRFRPGAELAGVAAVALPGGGTCSDLLSLALASETRPELLLNGKMSTRAGVLSLSGMSGAG